MNTLKDDPDLFKNSKKFMPTYIIVSLNIIMYVYTSLLGGNFLRTSGYVLWRYGQVNELVLNGLYWQLFTAMFVHVDITHIFGNMFFLLIFGLRAEEMFDIHEYLLIYLLSGLTGNLLTLVLWPSTVSAGASGAIFGLFGACTIYIRRAVGQSIFGALLFSFFLLVVTAGQGVNVLAHLGGLVTGLLIGYVLAIIRKRKALYKYKYSYSYHISRRTLLF